MQNQMSTEQAKAQAKERDNHRSQFCGISSQQHKEEFDRDLHAHHIIKDNDDGVNHPQNLITVCRECHNTLENTQADALSRIKNQHTTQVKEMYERRIKALEADLRKERNKESEVFAWLQDHSIEIHILLEGVFTPSVKTFREREDAAQVYAESDETTKLVSTQFNIGEMVEDSIRYSSANNTTLRFNSNGGDHFKSESNVEEYRGNDVPRKIKEELR